MAGLGSLAAWLRSLDDDALSRLCAARPDLLHPLPADFDALAARMSSAGSLASALDPLDRWSRHVLEAVMVTGAGVTPAVLVGLLICAPDQATSALDRLTAVGLVWPAERGAEGTDRPRDGLTSAAALREVIRYPCGLGPSIRPDGRPAGGRPHGYHVDDRGNAPAGDRRGGPWWSAYPVASADRARLTAAMADLEPAELAILDRLSGSNPVGAAASPPPPVSPATSEAAPSRVERLVAAGLLLPQPDGTVVLPGEVALILRGDRPLGDVEPEPPRPASTRVAGAGRSWDAVGGDAAATTVRLADDLLEMLARTPAAQLRSGGLGVRELRRIAADLRVEQATVALLLEVSHGAGLLTATHDHASLWLPSPAFDKWLAKDTAGRWAALAGAWLTLPRAPSSAGLRDDRDRTATPLGPDLAWWPGPRFRRAVLAALAGLQPGHTVDRAGLRRVLEWHHPSQALLFMSLHLDAALDEAEKLGVCGRGAITAAGRALLDGSTEWSVPAAVLATAAAELTDHLPQPVDHVLLQADLTAVAPGPLVPEVAREMSLLADVESSGAASVYRFSPSSVRRGLDAGRSAADIVGFLRARSRTPVPQTLEYLVADVGRRHGRMRVGSCQAFVRSDDEHLLAEVLADRRTHVLRLRALAPTVLAAQAQVSQVLDVLRKAGYAPATDGPSGAAVPGRSVGRRGPQPAPRVQPWAPPTPTGKAMATALRALRAADQLHQARAGGHRVHGQDSILQLLVQAARYGRALWITYVNADGVASQRVIEPIEVSGGLVDAFDHRRGSTRTFAVHRIAAVGTVDWDDDA